MALDVLSGLEVMHSRRWLLENLLPETIYLAMDRQRAGNEASDGSAELERMASEVVEAMPSAADKVLRKWKIADMSHAVHVDTDMSFSPAGDLKALASCMLALLRARPSVFQCAWFACGDPDRLTVSA